MISLPILHEAPTFGLPDGPPIRDSGEAAHAEPLPEPPWLHLLPGIRPLAFLVRGSQLFEVDEEKFKRLREKDEIAH
jgi:hypothetical protein